MASPSPQANMLASTPIIPWLVTAVVSVLALYVWGSSNAWQLGSLSTYQIFPVLGLLAFSIMWSHYMTGFIRKNFLKSVDLEAYFRLTGYVVLLAILLHPGLLIYQRFRDGFGLPPGSYKSYVAPGMGWITLLGSVSLLAFLAFELHRWFKDRSWWKYVIYAGDAAMLAIFYHGLRLGTQLHVTWFRSVWWFYGLTLLVAITYNYYLRIKTKTL